MHVSRCETPRNLLNEIFNSIQHFVVLNFQAISAMISRTYNGMKEGLQMLGLPDLALVCKLLEPFSCWHQVLSSADLPCFQLLYRGLPFVVRTRARTQTVWPPHSRGVPGPEEFGALGG